MPLFLFLQQPLATTAKVGLSTSRWGLKLQLISRLQAAGSLEEMAASESGMYGIIPAKYLPQAASPSHQEFSKPNLREVIVRGHGTSGTESYQAQGVCVWGGGMTVVRKGKLVKLPLPCS